MLGILDPKKSVWFSVIYGQTNERKSAKQNGKKPSFLFFSHSEDIQKNFLPFIFYKKSIAVKQKCQKAYFWQFLTPKN